MPTTFPVPKSVPEVCEVACVRGVRATADARPFLLLEVPHGATRGTHYDGLANSLRGQMPTGLRDFFFANTDVGAPEVAAQVAARVVEADPHRTVWTIRSLIPRTLIDCNRVIDGVPRPMASEPGGMTPAVPSYVRDPADLKLLHTRYSAYRALVERAVDTVCGEGGTTVFVHSYAPRNVDVPVDDKIVESLRAAYAPGVVEKWPMRAEVDLLTRNPAGMRLASDALVRAVQGQYEKIGVKAAADEAYSLHPSTMAAAYAKRFPGLTLCIEVRRDLLVRAFKPFEAMDVDPAKADRMALPLAKGLRAWWTDRRV